MMRVGLVIYGRLETVSGGYIYDGKLVEYLRQAGDQVQIISLGGRAYIRHLLDNFSPQLITHLRHSNFDVLLEDELAHPSLFWLNRRLRGRIVYPIISIVHLLRSTETNPPALADLYRAVEQRYLASVDGFIFNSETTRGLVPQFLGHSNFRSIVAYPAGDRFRSTITNEQIFARAGESRPLRVLFVGNVIPRKRVHVVIDALGHLPQERVQLSVVGNINLDKKYARLIQRQIADRQLSNIQFLGELVDEDLAHVMAQSDVLAMPSQYESFGMVYLEGMGFGLPALASANGAAREIVRDGVNGYLVAPEDVTGLAELLDNLSRDRTLLARLSLAAWSTFVSFPGWERTLSSIREKLASGYFRE